MKKIGILSLQGSVIEHVSTMQEAVAKLNLKASVREVKTKKELKDVDALVIPGGESTTIGKLINMYQLGDEVKRIAAEGKPILGTCAGLVLLSKDADENKYVLGLMDMKVKRNAFGRQRESFETELEIESLGGNYHAVFIRAPAISEVSENCRILSKYDEYIVMAQQDKLLALSFHPELTSDTRIQEYFLKMVP